MPQLSEIFLNLENISVHYGGVKALDNASVLIDEGEIVALMGPNGAGKSTILKALFGLVPVDSGKIIWHGREFVPKPHEVVSMGISFVPQGRRVFNHLTVEENLELGGVVVKDKAVLKQRIQEIYYTFPILKSKRKEKSGRLSGGQQQMLALARGLMSDPKVLLLDEPTLGLAPKVVKEIFQQIKSINQKHNTAIFIVEHNIKSMLDIVNRAYILNQGRVVAQGDASKLITTGVLEKVFLGLPLE